MNIWFTSDCHFGHKNAIEYARRPFNSLEDMDNALIRNWNERVKKGDMIFHLGDFCFRSGASKVNRGEGSIEKAAYWESKLNGRIIHIEGNHDKGNGVKSPISRAWLNYGGKQILLLHDPSTFLEDELPLPELVLCGHVHKNWRYVITELYRIPIVNVGVDMWNFRPISFKEISKCLNNEPDRIWTKEAKLIVEESRR